MPSPKFAMGDARRQQLRRGDFIVTGSSLREIVAVV